LGKEREKKANHESLVFIIKNKKQGVETWHKPCVWARVRNGQVEAVLMMLSCVSEW